MMSRSSAPGAISLRPFRPTDADAFARFLSDPASTVLTYGRLVPPQTADDVRRRRESERPVGRAGGSPTLLIWADASDVAVGVSFLSNIDTTNRTLWTGSAVLDPKHRGSGLGTQGRRLVLDHVFNEQGFRRAYGEFIAANEASRRSHQKVGAEFTGVRRQRFYVSGRWHDSVVYTVRRERFNELFPLDTGRYFAGLRPQESRLCGRQDALPAHPSG